MIIWLLSFGILFGLTVAVLAHLLGAGLLTVLLAYSFGGTFGMLSVALTYSFRPRM